MTGRWDIDYVKHPKKGMSKIVKRFTIAKLVAIKDNNPDAWDDLMIIIAEVIKA